MMNDGLNYCKENWHKLIFPILSLLFVFFMILEYYKGNCRIGKDIWVCSYIEHDYRKDIP